MKNEIRRQTMMRSAPSLLLIFFLIVAVLFGGMSQSLTAYAAVKDDLLFDESYIMDDLEGTVINGKEFSISDYSFDESRNTSVILFTEYCYSFYANKQGNYGLYVYVWNPQGLNIDVNSSLNMIQFGIDPDYSTSYSKYHLEFLSVCEETNYEGLFYKFKVYMTDSQRTAILNRLDSSERFYHVSGIELLTVGDTNATETAVNLEYTFSGYAEGYGPSTSSGDTLVCNTEQGEVLTLDVRSTYYRPSGINGDGLNTQDTLHSVYFAVPNSVIEDYGALTAVHAKWLNAQTSPIFVTGNPDVYNAVSEYVGQYMESTSFTYVKEDTSPLAYALIASKYADSASWNNAGYGLSYMSYNVNTLYTSSDLVLNYLYYCFYASNGDATSYVLSAEEILEWFSTYTAAHGGSLVNDKYSSVLFEQVDSEFTDKNIRADDTTLYSLTDATINRNWWESWLGTGGSVNVNDTYDEIPAVQSVSLADLNSYSLSADFCDDYYVAESDYDELYDYVQEAESNDETVFLFRYLQTEYKSYEVVEYERGEGTWTISGTQFGYEYIDTNAYFAQMWVQLDFDIIDVTFTNGGIDTVIPVVSSPMDVVADATPPVITTTDSLPWWAYVIVVVFELVALFVLRVVFCTVCGLPKWIWWILFIVIIALDIFFISTFAWWGYRILSG